MYALCHFCVDLACIGTLIGSIVPHFGGGGAVASVFAIVAYDMVAFCLQLPIGVLLDAWWSDSWRVSAFVSLALVGLGVLLGLVPWALTAFLAVLVIAVGNALFHCAGGEEVLDVAQGAAGPAGAFISTGALGVFFGTASAAWPRLVVVLILLVLLAASALALVSLDRRRSRGGLVFSPDIAAWITIILLAATVALRSYVGMAMAFPWKADYVWAFVAIIAVVAGKATGGYLADSVGPLAATIVSLGGSAPLFLLAWANPVAGVFATFLFNFTMAITLTALLDVVPRAPGTAFGIASFSLAIGAAPVLLGLDATGPMVLCVLSVVSLVLLSTALFISARVGQ